MVEAGIGQWEHPAPGGKGGQPSRVFVLSTGVYVNDTKADTPENAGNVDVDTVGGVDWGEI